MTRVPRNDARTPSKPIIQVVQEDSEGDIAASTEPGKPDVSTIRVVIGRDPNPVSGPSGQTPAPMPATTTISVGGAVTPVAQSTVVSEVSASGSCVSCGTVGCGGGCGTGRSKWRSCWDCIFAPATVPPVLGSTTQSIFMMQKNAALAEYFVVYREDFLANTNTLNKTGERHIEGILRRMNQTGAPLKVEPTGNSDFDQRRRITVVEALIRNGVPANEAQARVILGGTRAEGLRGLDIESLPYPNLMGGGVGGMGGGMGGFGGGMGGFGGGFGGGMGGFGGFR